MHAYESIAEARSSIAQWFGFYNFQRPHQSLGYLTPCEAHNKGLLLRPSPGLKLNAELALNMVSSSFTGVLNRHS